MGGAGDAEEPLEPSPQAGHRGDQELAGGGQEEAGAHPVQAAPAVLSRLQLRARDHRPRA